MEKQYLPPLPRKRRLILTVTVLLTIGFVATSLLSYFVSGVALREQVRNTALPLTADNIYSDIRNDLLPPIYVSAAMARNTFLRDWVLDGEQDISQITKYLTEVRSRTNTISAFFVSEKTRKYYHPSGVIEKVTSREPSDAWYFRVRKMDSDYEVNVDVDQANAFMPTVFINYKVYDYDRNLIGAAGVGLRATTMLERIDRYEQRYNREIYFVDPDGRIALQAGRGNGRQQDIRETEGLGLIAGDILGARGGIWEYPRGGKDIMLDTRYIPELNWTLFVEQPASMANGPVRNALFLNLGLGLIVAALVVWVVQISVQRYQQRLERMATTDNLTGIANRHSFEMLVEPYASRSAAGTPNSVMLMDLDRLKEVNDRYGHMAGDEVIREVAELARDVLRSTDVLCRWGGEEFVAWLRGCNAEDAADVAEKLRRSIRGHGFTGRRVTVTASIGVVEHRPGETLEATLSRADQAMYDAKAEGRDRIRVAHT